MLEWEGGCMLLVEAILGLAKVIEVCAGCWGCSFAECEGGSEARAGIYMVHKALVFYPNCHGP